MDHDSIAQIAAQTGKAFSSIHYAQAARNGTGR
jgi:hypothetical protein